MRKDAVNLYEFSWLGVAEYSFHKKWGTKPQQLEAINLAIAYEPKSEYLPEEMFISALVHKFVLQMEMSYFRSALETYADLIEQETLSDQVKAQLAAYVDKITQIEEDHTSYSMSHDIGESGYWRYPLLWNRFALKPQKGDISHVRVHCDRKYIGFEFSEEMIYTVDGDPGNCSVSFHGEPGERVTLYRDITETGV